MVNLIVTLVKGIGVLFVSYVAYLVALAYLPMSKYLIPGTGLSVSFLAALIVFICLIIMVREK
jgi:hypothetical protein